MFISVVHSCSVRSLGLQVTFGYKDLACLPLPPSVVADVARNKSTTKVTYLPKQAETYGVLGIVPPPNALKSVEVHLYGMECMELTPGRSSRQDFYAWKKRLVGAKYLHVSFTNENKSEVHV